MGTMIVEEAKSLAGRAPRDPEQVELPRGATAGDIDLFQHRTGVLIPAPLREWLSFTNGPHIGSGGVCGIGTSNPITDIEYRYTLYPKWKDHKWIPIASDGFGNFYVMISENTPGDAHPLHPIVFIDTHENSDDVKYIVASDLWHFLLFYLRNDLGERGWPCNKDKVLGDDPEIGGEAFEKYRKCWEY